MLSTKLKNSKQSLHRTKVAVREVADAQLIYRSNPITISSREFSVILESLKRASLSFTTTVKGQITNRARSLFRVSMPSPEQKIKSVFSHRDFGRTKGNMLEDAEAMKMVDRALKSDTREIRLFCTGFPMKIFSPLETNYQGDSVDLGDISVLLRFAELAEVLTHFGSQIGKKFSVVIVSDGRMNAGMFKVDPRVCDSYVAKLNAMISELDISSFVSVREFSFLLVPHESLRKEYEHLTKKIKAGCHAKFDHLLNLEDLGQSIKSALRREYCDYHKSSFGYLFNSTIGSVRYDRIEQFSKNFGLDFLKTYSMILESILWGQKVEQTKSYKGLLVGLSERTKANFLKELRRERSVTMRKAWHSTIEYFAVLEVNQATKILDALFPDGVRITTRPKKGQIGVHTSDQNCPALFSYHSVPVILPCNKGKNVKVDFQLRFNALKSGYRPILLNGTDIICYEHPNVSSLPIEQLPWMRGSNRSKKIRQNCGKSGDHVGDD